MSKKPFKAKSLKVSFALHLGALTERMCRRGGLTVLDYLLYSDQLSHRNNGHLGGEQ